MSALDFCGFFVEVEPVLCVNFGYPQVLRIAGGL